MVKKLLLDHIVLGASIDLTNTTNDISFKTLGGRTVQIQHKDGKLTANDANIIEKKIQVPNGTLIVLDKYLFPEEEEEPVKNITSQAKLVDLATEQSTTIAKNNHQSNTTFVENVLEVLSFLKSGVRVFQHFLSRSNVSKLLKDGKIIIFTALVL